MLSIYSEKSLEFCPREKFSSEVEIMLTFARIHSSPEPWKTSNVISVIPRCQLCSKQTFLQTQPTGHLGRKPLREAAQVAAVSAVGRRHAPCQAAAAAQRHACPGEAS